jgi:hypothetical protein
MPSEIDHLVNRAVADRAKNIGPDLEAIPCPVHLDAPKITLRATVWAWSVRRIPGHRETSECRLNYCPNFDNLRAFHWANRPFPTPDTVVGLGSVIHATLDQIRICLQHTEKGRSTCEWLARDQFAKGDEACKTIGSVIVLQA